MVTVKGHFNFKKVPVGGLHALEGRKSKPNSLHVGSVSMQDRPFDVRLVQRPIFVDHNGQHSTQQVNTGDENVQLCMLDRIVLEIFTSNRTGFEAFGL